MPGADLASANRASNPYAIQAQAEFTRQNYDRAIAYYLKYLSQARKDYNAWNQLAASYYHTGQPKKALKLLKQVEKLTTDRSYNFFYQGLCYESLDQIEKAKQYFQYSAQIIDEYGSRATFELASIEYIARNKERSSYWLGIYQSRYPNGVYRSEATRLQHSLSLGIWVESVNGIEKPDMEKALYRFSKLSLSEYPHFWFLQLGGGYNVTEGFEPKIKENKSALGALSNDQVSIIANLGLGIGPWRQGSLTAFSGYVYRQNWFTDTERLTTWEDDPADFKYFPFRGDLLQRRHQFFADIRKEVSSFFFFGAFERLEFSRIGSTYFPSPDDSELKRVIKISDTTVFIPWFGFAYLKDFRTHFYLYMRKEINNDTPEYSNKTYDFTTAEPHFSLGISHVMGFPELGLTTDIELFQYHFTYNDYWLDYQRQGGILSVDLEFIPRWNLQAYLGSYEDAYDLERIKQGSCASEKDLTSADSDSNEPVRCKRNDTGLLYSGGLYWNYTQYTRFAVNMIVVENSNAEQKEFQTKTTKIEFAITTAFPSVKRVDRFINRFADSAFTKEAE